MSNCFIDFFFTADLFAPKMGSRELGLADEGAEDTYTPEKKKEKSKKGGKKERKKKERKKKGTTARCKCMHSMLIRSRTKTVTALQPSTSRVH